MDGATSNGIMFATHFRATFANHIRHIVFIEIVDILSCRRPGGNARDVLAKGANFLLFGANVCVIAIADNLQ